MQKNTPVYKRIISRLARGFNTLNPETQKEISLFITSQQNSNGSFCDRAGKTDAYYSLFGLWLSRATKQTENLQKLLQSINKLKTSSPVEELAVALIEAELNPASAKQSTFSLLKLIYKNSANIDISYRFFLFALTFDALAKNKRLVHCVARMWLRFYSPKGNMPCSVIAALTFARSFLNLESISYQQKLMSYHMKNSGFKAFKEIQNSDMLSTGVALFALAETNYDVRLIAPDCLDFVQNNYESGAFLSGDGDLTKDLEYTFYGLLALGSVKKGEG